MMENASQSSPRGVLCGWDDEDVAAGLGFATEQVVSIREAMQGKTLDGQRLTAWEKRQPKREDTSAERTRLWREAQKEDRDASKRNVTQRDAAADAVTLETETETEEKKQKALGQRAARFEEFWAAYPNKKGKSDALRTWKRKGLDRIADRILADVRNRQALDRDWLKGFIPHGSTYVNAEGWQDALERPLLQAVAGSGYQPMPGEI